MKIIDYLKINKLVGHSRLGKKSTPSQKAKYRKAKRKYFLYKDTTFDE